MGNIVFTKQTSDIKGNWGTPVIDNRRAVRGTITFSSSYATGGDTLTLNTQCSLREVTGLLVDASTVLTNPSGLSVELSGTKDVPKIIAYDANNTQVANATDLSTRSSIPVILLGA